MIDKSSESLHLNILWHSCRYNHVRKTNQRFSPQRSPSVTNLREQSCPCESWGKSASQISSVLQRCSNSEERDPACVKSLDQRLTFKHIQVSSKHNGMLSAQVKKACLVEEKKKNREQICKASLEKYVRSNP